MNTGEIITLQFGNYSNYIGAHWWNIQEASFIYSSEDTPEISYDVLFREGENYKMQVTYTPRVLLVDVKGSLGGLPLFSDLYEEPCIPDVKEEIINWSEKTEVYVADKYKKNQFLNDLEYPREKMDIDGGDANFQEFMRKYDLDDDVNYWSDYLATKFHPRSIALIPEYQHNNSENSFATFTQGTELWKTDLFVEDWTDNCRAYAEECDYLQGFQILFDCYNGFSGLSNSALNHLQDEYSSKSVFGFPVVASAYLNSTESELPLQIVNCVLSVSELIELSTAFVPLCTNEDCWSEVENCRKFSNLTYNNKLAYHSSSLLASFLDCMSLSYRQRKNSSGLYSLLSKLTPCGRKLLTATLSLPFPILADHSVLECFEKLENVFWTSITPKTNVTVDSAVFQELNLRGLSSYPLLPRKDKRISQVAQSYQSIQEMFCTYLDFCSTDSQASRFFVNSFDLPLKIPQSYPNIFSDKVTRVGCVVQEPMPHKLAVVETPVLSGLHNCSSASLFLEDLYGNASKIRIKSLHHFSTTGLEQLEYSEAIEKLLSLKENYD